MPSNICQPKYDVGRNITGRASAAVTGKRFIVISGNAADGVPLVAHAGAGAAAFGVSGYDAAAGDLIPTVRGGVVPVTAGAALSAGNEVESDANGQAVVLAAGKKIGTVLFDAAVGDDALVALNV